MTPAPAAAIAAGLALAGWRLGWLSWAGTAAAAIVGTGVLWGAGVDGFLLLGAFFVSGSLLSHRSGHAGRRTAAQVAANGWGAAAGGFLIPLAPSLGWTVLVGSLAAAQADTWATEIGRRSPRAPVLLTTGLPVVAGTSGGVTWMGTLGGVLGALTIAGLAILLSVPIRHPAGLVVAGTVGMFADSLLGATIQARGRCAVCGTVVEQRGHCDRPTSPEQGVPWMTNDTVNAIGAGVGAAAALLLALL